LAEKSSKYRVSTLAKELGVESKAIIAKCQAEGLDQIKKHTDVLTAGLAATIREWFSEGAHATTLEESQRVNLEVVRVRARKAKSAESDESGEASGNVATMAPPEEPPAALPAKPAAKPKPFIHQETIDEPDAPAPAPMVEANPVPTAPSSPKPEIPQQAAAVAPSAAPPHAVKPAAHHPAPAAPPAPPPRSAVAGPQNVPMPARLSGPKVVRMDKPDFVDAPRPSVRPRPAARGPGFPPPRGPLPVEEDKPGHHDRHGRGKPAADDAVGDPATEKKPVKKPVLRDVRDEVNEKLREWRDRDLIERRDRLAHASGRGIGGLRAVEGKQSSGKRGTQRQAQVITKKDKAQVTEPIYIKDFSRESGIAVSDILKKLMQDFAELATINTVIDTEKAQLIAQEFGIELEVVKAKTGLDRIKEQFDALPRENPRSRPPVVTVLGHVDHGKTSLLDRIRNANVAKGEAGGITQHIGAYRVKVGERWVAFLDTPGHTAFTAMRARGTNMTDVVVLVVAADDGVMPTTVEAINHAKAAGTPIVVALNKIDLPHDINKIYGQLAAEGLTPSGDWGGETDVIKTSATQGIGIDDLLAHLATLSDVMDLKADPEIPATGTVIEAQRTEGLGNIARVLVQEGTLRAGDVIVCGGAHGRVRALKDERGRNLKEAGPSTPIEVTGLSDVPMAGDRFYVVETPQLAKEIAEEVAAKRREEGLFKSAKPTTLEGILAKASEGQIPELKVIVRADVQGSVDVLKKTLSEFPSDQVKLTIMHAGVGTVTESDVVLAQASEAIIIAFHVVPEAYVQKMAENSGVDIRSYRIIYNVVDDIKKALEGLLTPDEKIESRGRAEVREVFMVSRVGKVAGCYVRDGVIQRNHVVRVIRDGVPVKERAAIESLRRVKDDVKEVKAGFECGIRVANFDDVKPGDVIEALEVIKVARTL
jgi:translation initiation factor IF-2